MDSRPFLAVALLTLGYGTLYLPQWLFQQNPKLTGHDLASSHPELATLERIFLWYAAVAACAWLAVFGMFVFIFQDQAGISIFLGTFFAGIAVGNANFAFVTGVYPVPILKNYFFVYDRRVRNVGLGHLALGLAQIALGVCFTFTPWSLWARP